MISDTEKSLLGIMMILIMFGMGSGLTWRDFFKSIQRPQKYFGWNVVPVWPDATDRLWAW